MAHDTQSSRRGFLSVLGAGIAAAGTAAASSEATAQAATPSHIVDFHNHYMGPSWTLTNLARMPAPARAAWEKINANLQSESALIGSMESAGVEARVINTPTAFIEDADGKVAPDAIRRINDQMAELVDKRAGRLYGLATVDAFAGDEGAAELTRAVRELRLRGVFLESAKRDLVLGDKETRPTLAAAAALDVPVFVHPLTDPQLDKRFARSGRIGVRFARGTINSAALINMLEGGTFDEIPKLKVVVTTLAFGGVMLAAGFGDGQRIRPDAAPLARRHVYIDTMGIHPAVIRTAIDLLGADHVLVGTDWPIAVEASVPKRLKKAFAHAGLTAAEQEMIASGNTLQLLKVT
jgi:predicted TIM-barrel fold metal-dependent hydrolase